MLVLCDGLEIADKLISLSIDPGNKTTLEKMAFKHFRKVGFQLKCWVLLDLYRFFLFEFQQHFFHEINTQRKKSTKMVPLGYYCYKWYPFFNSSTVCFFMLAIKLVIYRELNVLVCSLKMQHYTRQREIKILPTTSSKHSIQCNSLIKQELRALRRVFLVCHV